MICCLLVSSFHGIQLYLYNWRNYFQAGEYGTKEEKNMQLEVPGFFSVIYSLKPLSCVPRKPDCCEWWCSSSSWSRPRVLKCLWKSRGLCNPSPQTTKHVSSAAKIQTLASHTRYAFGPVKEMCNSLLSNQSMPNIWGRNTFGPLTLVVVESLWRKKGESCSEGVIGTGPPWFTPRSHVGEERKRLQGWCHLMSGTRLLEETAPWYALPAVQQPYSY